MVGAGVEGGIGIGGVEVEDQAGHPRGFPVVQTQVHRLAEADVPAEVVAVVVAAVILAHPGKAGELGLGVGDRAEEGRQVPADGGDLHVVDRVVHVGLELAIGVGVGHIGAVAGLTHALRGRADGTFGELGHRREASTDAAVGENTRGGVGVPGTVVVADFGLGVVEGVGGVVRHTALLLVPQPPVGRFIHGVLLR